MISGKHIDKNGDEYWLSPNGKRHREDGPAVIFKSGYTSWYNCGTLHREDGPAVIFADGDQWWYLCGKQYTYFNDYCSMLKSHYGKTEEDIMMIRMQYDTD